MLIWLKTYLLSFFGALRRSMVGPYAKAILTQAENGLLLVPPSDMFVGRKLCFNGRYDHEDLQVLLRACSGDSSVLVVGAHIGALAIPLAKKTKSLVGVDANPATFELLRMNVLLNDLQNVELYSFAAGDRSEEVSLLESRLNTGGSKLKMGEWNKWMYVYDKPEAVTVQMQRLDDVFANSVFDLIVMDIEGSETRALRGMRGLLERSGALMLEIVEHHLRNIAKVSNTEFLSLLSPHFDEAVVLGDASQAGDLSALRRWPKSAFDEMMLECCKRGSANVLFTKALRLPREGLHSGDGDL